VTSRLATSMSSWLLATTTVMTVGENYAPAGQAPLALSMTLRSPNHARSLRPPTLHYFANRERQDRSSMESVLPDPADEEQAQQYCSYAVTGTQTSFQAIYVCRTCCTVESNLLCLCQACADSCHSDCDGLEYIGKTDACLRNHSAFVYRMASF
jgi:hypothetical protein